MPSQINYSTRDILGEDGTAEGVKAFRFSNLPLTDLTLFGVDDVDYNRGGIIEIDIKSTQEKNDSCEALFEPELVDGGPVYDENGDPVYTETPILTSVNQSFTGDLITINFDLQTVR